MVATQQSLSIGTLQGQGMVKVQGFPIRPFHRGSGVLSRSMRKNLPSSAFGLPKQRKYPITSRGHAIAAKSRATEGLRKKWINKAEYNKIVAKANKKLNS